MLDIAAGGGSTTGDGDSDVINRDGGGAGSGDGGVDGGVADNSD